MSGVTQLDWKCGRRREWIHRNTPLLNTSTSWLRRKRLTVARKQSGFNRPRGLRRTMPSTACCIDLNPLSNELWQEAKAYVELDQGMLVVDDTMLDKWYAKQMELVSRQWSGKHKRVVQGINLTSLLWSDGDKHIPCDYPSVWVVGGRSN